MECIICNTSTEYYFEKTYPERPYGAFVKDMGKIKYHKCPNCGFVFSKTHYELSDDRWKKLNYDFHHFLESKINFKGQPPYLEQATMIKILAEAEIINIERSIDYAGGYGTLSSMLDKYFQVKLMVFDPFVQSEQRNIYIPKENLGKYSVVLNSALFEHLRTRQSFDEIHNCVEDGGAMIIHTVICENIPKDPNWFYLSPPVHCSFHTNNSMNILMKDWGYTSSIYCPTAKSWTLLRADPAEIQIKVEKINKELQSEFLIYKRGFVDYWKGF